MTKDINLMQPSLLRFLLGFRSCPFPWTLLALKFPLCFKTVLPSKLAPPPDAPLRQIHSVVNEMSSGAKCHIQSDFIINVSPPLQGFKLIIDLSIFLCVRLCPVYCPLLFAFECCAVCVIGHLTHDSAD
jgi:hypothetical protein